MSIHMNSGVLAKGLYFTLFLQITSVVMAVDSTIETAFKARAILKQHCLRCHSGEGSDGGDFNVMSSQDLIDSKLIKAGKPEKSVLFDRIYQNEMPPRTIETRLTDDEKIIFKNWIQSGAIPFPLAKNRKFLSLEETLTVVRDYLRGVQNRNDLPYLRFFNLRNLYNNKKVVDSDLHLYRAALSKACNSLSWHRRISLPVAIDKEKTIYVVDIRNYKWEKEGKWDAVMGRYPYGLKYGNMPNSKLKNLSEDIEQLTECGMSIIRADWFVSTATRPPLYHQMLDIPKTAAEIEKQLGVNVLHNFLNAKPEVITRGAVSRSRVSGQNRMLERHETKFGFYWKSYDFIADNARAKMTRYPLGPKNLFDKSNKKHPFPRQAFDHDGCEIIWTLPNKLQAYMLVNKKEKRIDFGPVSVVSDSLKTSGTAEIFNGLSCISCHKKGMIPFVDVVRNGSSLFGESEAFMKQLYPKQKIIDDFLKEDGEMFMKALGKATKPFLMVGKDKNKQISNFPEPVGEVARLHRLVYLDIHTIAAELSLESPEILLRKVGEKKLKKLGLGSLMNQKGVISRAEWEATDGVSLMQELARECRYTPYHHISDD